ncbi:MAG: histidine kinase, partial [Alkaliphilus sp.]
LDLKDTNLIPLQEEMNISKRYLDIMSLRFSDHLNVILNIDTSICNTLVPSLILLPILENSIKHGYSYEKTDLEIELFILAVFGVVVYYVYNFYSRVFYGTTILNNIY